MKNNQWEKYLLHQLLRETFIVSYGSHFSNDVFCVLIYIS